MDHSRHYAQASSSRLHGSPHPSSSSPQPDPEDIKPAITPTTSVRAASAPHPSSSTNPRKRARQNQEPDRGPDHEQKQMKHRLRAAERRAKQSQSLAELSALLPDSLQLYQDKADLRVVPQVITYIHQLQGQISDLEGELERKNDEHHTTIQGLQEIIAQMKPQVHYLGVQYFDVMMQLQALKRENVYQIDEIQRLRAENTKYQYSDSASIGTTGRPMC